MAKAKQQAKRHTKSSRAKRTPEPKQQIPVIGSSCTRKESELDQFKVKVCRDVDVRGMIPEKFFSFEHLEYCTDYTCPFNGSESR